MKRTIHILVAACVLSLSGCMLAPAIDSFNQLGVTKADRMQLLPLNVKRYQDALYWGRPDEALMYVLDTSRPALSDNLRVSRKSERIMESSVEGVDYSEDAYTAEVEVIVRFLNTKFHTNVIEERTEQQEWAFSVNEGWKLKSVQRKDA